MEKRGENVKSVFIKKGQREGKGALGFGGRVRPKPAPGPEKGEPNALCTEKEDLWSGEKPPRKYEARTGEKRLRGEKKRFCLLGAPPGESGAKEKNPPPGVQRGLRRRKNTKEEPKIIREEPAPKPGPRQNILSLGGKNITCRGPSALLWRKKRLPAGEVPS